MENEIDKEPEDIGERRTKVHLTEKDKMKKKELLNHGGF